MSTLTIRMFGKFSAQYNDHILEELHSCKIQELFCYLLLHRDHAHSREVLASLLWGDNSTSQSRKYLRQALWQLQMHLEHHIDSECARVLLVESDWVSINLHTDLWLDVAILEHAYKLFQGIQGQKLDAQQAQKLQDAVTVYQGDLLEGRYQDWCLCERERLQSMYLAMIDKLMSYCEVHHEYDAGIAHGERILRYDRAHERTHQRLMRLQYLAGDRATALRQYERCVTALHEELDVKPARRTMSLYEQIRADMLNDTLLSLSETPPLQTLRNATSPPIQEILDSLRQLRAITSDLQSQVEHSIQAIELNISSYSDN